MKALISTAKRSEFEEKPEHLATVYSEKILGIFVYHINEYKQRDERSAETEDNSCRRLNRFEC